MDLLFFLIVMELDPETNLHYTTINLVNNY